MSDGGAAGTGVGQPVRRKEDVRLLTGRGSYGDDVGLPGQAHAAMVRSPHAHARIHAIDRDAALAVPGVLAVLTGADLLADGLNSVRHAPSLVGTPDVQLVNRDGSEHFISPRFPLPADKARFCGEAVAMVVGETEAAAREGAERVAVTYHVLPHVTAATEASADGAPRVWPQHGNVCVDAELGDRAACDAAFAGADHVVRLETRVNRVTGVPMEPRAWAASYDAASGRYTVWGNGINAVRHKQDLATILGVAPDAVRVVYRDTGGNFGTRGMFYPECALVAWAARRLGRPVKWCATRQECFLSDFHGRDLAVEAELALDRHGNFLALRSSNTGNLGAVTASFVPLTKGAGLMSSVYRIPVAHVRARAALTNTAPTSVYRSAGRPEAMFVIERLIDLAARRHGFDRVALRRRNLVPAAAMPYANPLGLTYDNGDYEAAMDWCLGIADWAGFAARREESRRRGRLRGIGLANYVEITTGAPRERTEITVLPEGRVEIVIGTQSSGQGHETSFAQPVSEWLGVPFDCIDLVTGDTDRVPVGGGSNSGRSMRYAGILMGKASDAIIAKGRRIAAHVLETSADDIEFAGGLFRVAGTDRTLGIFAAADAARRRDDLPEDLRGPLASEQDETFRVAGFPYGSHVCEVEIDPETGLVALARYAAVDDVGRAVNPLILHGQAHGAIAQGVGQALTEDCHYDAQGQLLSATFMDYALPRADLLPSFRTEISEVPSPTNPLGIRAGGEGGTTPALAAVVNAIVDALAAYGVTHIEMPATPERVWRAMRAGSRAN
ncbi:MAG TPA: xanthine dehydrogenase family protein molybdopterin-binding subunit [Stellaceae bacterium]|nr:xanthine dehydrogenase family protein molybdopterin-binding subunit [Stellaceae bacterium]